jgi:hypothetical protein
MPVMRRPQSVKTAKPQHTITGLRNASPGDSNQWYDLSKREFKKEIPVM